MRAPSSGVPWCPDVGQQPNALLHPHRTALMQPPLHPNSRSRWACYPPIAASLVPLSPASRPVTSKPACQTWALLALMPARCQIAPALDVSHHPQHHGKGGQYRGTVVVPPIYPSIQSTSSAHRDPNPHCSLAAHPADPRRGACIPRRLSPDLGSLVRALRAWCGEFPIPQPAQPAQPRYGNH
jgi:hypothetical protein